MKKFFILFTTLIASASFAFAEGPDWNEVGHTITVSSPLVLSDVDSWFFEEDRASTTSSLPATFVVRKEATGSRIYVSTTDFNDLEVNPVADDDPNLGTVAFKHVSLNTTLAPYAIYRYSIPYQIAKIYPIYDSFGYITGYNMYRYKVTEIVDEEISGSAFVNALVVPHTIEYVPKNASLNFNNVDTVYVYSSIAKFEPHEYPTRFLPENVEVVIFEDGVDSVPAYLCASQSKLHKVVLPEGLISIGTTAFHSTSALKTIDLPSSIQYIGMISFEESGLTKITIPENVKEIGQRAFVTNSLDSVEFNAKNCVLGETMYYDWAGHYSVWPSYNIKSFSIGNKVDTIPEYLCENMSALTKIKIPANVKKICYNAFDGCTGLEKVEIDDLAAWCKIQFYNNPLTEAHHLFLKGKEIKELVLPDDVTEVGFNAFRSCNGLISVNTNNAKIIGHNAFEDCEGLTTITIGEKLESLCSTICNGCKNLNTIYWNATDCSCDYYTFTIGDEEFQNHITKVVFGNNKMKKIPAGLCGNMINLTSITIPSNIEEIGHYAFENCSNLTSISLPNTVSTIGNSAFEGCSNLERFVIPDSVKRIEYATFMDCSNLQEVTFGEGITYVADYAFNGCDKLSSVVWNAIDCPDLSSPIFYKEESYFDDEENYISEVKYHPEITSVTFGNKVKHIPAKLCYFMNNLGHVDIPSSVESIGRDAFYYCDFLDAAVPNTVQTVSSEAFYGVPNIIYNGTLNANNWDSRAVNGYVENNLVFESEQKSLLKGCSMRFKGAIEIPNTVTKIDEYAFSKCQLSDVIIPSSVTTIKDHAFEDCKNLTAVAFPNSVTNAGSNIFAGCTSLNTPVYSDKLFVFLPIAYEGAYTIPEGIEQICESAFLSREKLTEVVCPNTLSKIKYMAFGYCKNLRCVTLPAAVNTIASSAFYQCKSLSYIYAHPTTPPSIKSNTFGGVPKETCKLYIPKQSIDLYSSTEGWKNFMNIRPINAQESMISDVIVAASATSVVLSWYRLNNATAYAIDVRNVALNDIVCTYLFDAEGYIMGAHYARSRYGQNNSSHSMKTNNGWQYTIDGLEPDTEYAYSVIAKDSSGNVLDEKSGTFTTKSNTPEALNNVSAALKTAKLIRNGHLFILRDGEIYNAQGARVE